MVFFIKKKKGECRQKSILEKRYRWKRLSPEVQVFCLGLIFSLSPGHSLVFVSLNLCLRRYVFVLSCFLSCPVSSRVAFWCWLISSRFASLILFSSCLCFLILSCLLSCLLSSFVLSFFLSCLSSCRLSCLSLVVILPCLRLICAELDRGFDAPRPQVPPSGSPNPRLSSEQNKQRQDTITTSSREDKTRHGKRT
jgi:hypothetical protein